jgi:hypothetical protein
VLGSGGVVHIRMFALTFCKEDKQFFPPVSSKSSEYSFSNSLIAFFDYRFKARVSSAIPALLYLNCARNLKSS